MSLSTRPCKAVSCWCKKTVTPTITPTISITPTITQTSEFYVTITPTISQTLTPTITSSETVTPTPTITSSETVTPTPTITSSETVTPTPTITSSEIVTPTPTITPTNTTTITPTPTISTIVYISVCCNQFAGPGNNIDINAYSDILFGSFGATPISVNTNVTVFVTVTGLLTGAISGAIIINSGQSYGVGFGEILDGDEIIGLQIDSISPTYFGYQEYVEGGESFNGSCLNGPTPTPTNTETATPTVTQTVTITPTVTQTQTPSLTLTESTTLTPSPTPTITPTTCGCYFYDVITFEDDILRASGNTDTERNGVVYVTYRNCDDTSFTNITFDNTQSPYLNAICVNGLSQYNPPSIFIWQDNVQKTDISSFVTKQSCCIEVTPTPTPTNNGNL